MVSFSGSKLLIRFVREKTSFVVSMSHLSNTEIHDGLGETTHIDRQATGNRTQGKAEIDQPRRRWRVLMLIHPNKSAVAC